VREGGVHGHAILLMREARQACTYRSEVVQFLNPGAGAPKVRVRAVDVHARAVHAA
jgi:hypothetical protein